MTRNSTFLIRSSLAAAICTLLFAATAAVTFVGPASAAPNSTTAAPIVAPLA